MIKNIVIMISVAINVLAINEIIEEKKRIKSTEELLTNEINLLTKRGGIKGKICINELKKSTKKILNERDIGNIKCKNAAEHQKNIGRLKEIKENIEK